MNKKLEKLKDQQEVVFGQMAEILNGVSSPVRIKLIHFLSQGPLTVEVLAIKIGQSVANTSMHLRKMLASHIVSVSVHSQKRLYTLHPAAFEFWEACQNFTQKVDTNLRINSSEVYDDIEWEEDINYTLKMVKKNEAILVDVRPSDEVVDTLDELNVLNIPSNELAKNLSKLPKKKPLLIFCRGRFCALSAHAVNELRALGYNAYRLNQSWYALKKSSTR